MARVAVVVPGREERFVTARTVGDVKAEVGVAATYTAAVDGEPVDDNFVLTDHQFVTLAAPVKGG